MCVRHPVCCISLSLIHVLRTKAHAASPIVKPSELALDPCARRSSAVCTVVMIQCFPSWHLGEKPDWNAFTRICREVFDRYDLDTDIEGSRIAKFARPSQSPPTSFPLSLGDNHEDFAARIDLRCFYSRPNQDLLRVTMEKM